MADLGWCPAQYAHLSRKHSCNILHYISGFFTPAGVSHAQCSSSGCVAFNIDDSSYVSRHEESCELEMCELVDVTSTAVSDIIEDDYGIPLISCSLASNGRIQIQVVRAKPQYRYIAISHVWSGGLGNPKKNALPECAVKHILSRIKKLRRTMSKSTAMKSYLISKEPVLFWMDTFCIPVGAAFCPARKKAINQMTEIYSGAEAILALDPQLQSLRWAEMRPEEALVHVLCCPWMSRCWTLQEVSLADSWFIQFDDIALNLVTTAKRARLEAMMSFIFGLGKVKPSLHRSLIDGLSAFLTEMGEMRYQRRGRYSRSEIWNLKQLEAHQAYTFAISWNNFLGRTTSKMEDLHQILAGVSDMRVTDIPDIIVEDRMKAIVKCHATLPIDLLFCPCDRIFDANSVNR